MILGSIASVESGGLSVLIDGEDTPTEKEYCFLASYAPIAGDRVIIEEINGTYVVLGKVIASGSGETYADRAGYADSAGTASYAVSCGTASTAAYATSAGTAASATTASYATTAGSANYANSANQCTSASSASYATSAGTASYANTAGTASYATSCGSASTAAMASNVEAVKDWNTSWADYKVYFRINSGKLQYATGTYYTWTTLQNE